MDLPSMDRTRDRAYAIWEQEGRPEGRAMEHWLAAEAELAMTNLEARAALAGTAAKSGRRRKAPQAISEITVAAAPKRRKSRSTSIS
jgi:hypothetical protein